MSAALAYIESYREGWQLDPRLSLPDWADANIILSEIDSAEPGRFRMSRTPYMREPAECLSTYHPCKRVVIVGGAQTAKTRLGLNWIGYTMDASPVPMLVVEPSLDVMKRVSKQRIAPMIESTPSLRAKVREARSRDSGNTVLMKDFPGGVLIMTGANSAAGLRSMPIARLFLDEVDEYPGDVEGQGDPIELAEARTSNFPLAKTLLTSTPTIKGLSRIEREYLISDQRRYFLPCPKCGVFDWLRWERIEWDEGKPETARCVCLSCSARIPESAKHEMLPAGQWRATATGDGITAGFHLSSLYSPLGWRSWSDCARRFVAAKGDPFKLKTWVNTILAETWEERGATAKPEGLKARRARFAAEVPNGVGILVGSADVQGDRIEAAVWGFGAGEEWWLIAFEQMFGDPEQSSQVWNDLAKFWTKEFEHESGQRMKVERAFVDSGGVCTERVYQWTKGQLLAGRHFYPCKGGSETGKPLVGRPSITNRFRVPLFVLCTDSGKDIVVGRLNINAQGPGFLHLPEWCDDELIEQFTSEKGLYKHLSGRGTIRVWEKTRERNEGLDLAVYAIAGLYSCGPATLRALPERAFKYAQRVDAAPTSEESSEPARSMRRPTPRRNGWMKGYSRG